MKKSLYKVLMFTILALFLLAACAPASPVSNPGDSVDTPTTVPTPFKNEVPVPEAARAAQQDLVDRLGISLDQIQIREIEQVQWPNACLGAAKPDEMCAEVLVDGFRIVFDVNGQTYTYHTNMDGSQFRVVEPSDLVVEKPMPTAVEGARQLLAQQLGLALNQIDVVSVTQVEWPDSCLGVENPDMMCAQVITPGYRVILQANEEQYIFHTDLEGGAVVQAQAQTIDITGMVLSWQHTEDGICKMLEIGPEGVMFGLCDENLSQADLPAGRLEELAEMLAAYAPFNAETAAGSVTFNGQGEQEVSEAVQRSLAEWARLLYQEVEAGRIGAAWGMAFAWHREGGIAGFCDDLFVSLTGWADVTTCQPGNQQDLIHIRLDADQLEQLYAWVDQYENFEYEQKDPAVADAMTVRLVFSGSGSEEPTLEQQEEIVQFASLLYTTASR